MSTDIKTNDQTETYERQPRNRIPRISLKTDSYGMKVTLIIILLICFQLPLQMIRSTVSERQWMRQDVEEEIVQA